MAFVHGTTHRIRVFNRLTIAANGTAYSRWIKLDRGMQGHGVNGAISGTGTFALSYTIASLPDIAFGDVQGNIVTGVTDGGADDPFVKTLTIKPAAYIRFTATETGGVNPVVITLVLTQVS